MGKRAAHLRHVYDLTPPPAEQHLLLGGVAGAVAVYDVRGRADVDRLVDLVLERALSRPGCPA